VATEQVASSAPRGSFTVWQRVLRGYGPLAVLIVFVLLLAYLIPSKAPKENVNASNANNSTDDQGLSLAPGETVPAGQAGGGSTQSNAGVPGATAKGVVTACTGRTDQIPGDPYSPPCKTFSGDNGGATAQGVTKDSIDVAYRVLDEKGFQQTLAQLAGATLSDTPQTVTRTVQALAEYFNKNFQFYGRKINIKTFNGKGSLTNELVGTGQEQANADALTVGQSLKAFADLSAGSEPYSDALFRQKVLAFGDPYLSRQWHEQRKPYAWSLATDCTILAEEVANYTLARLQPYPAALAGGALKNKPRKIAAMAPDNSWYQECVGTVREILKKHGTDVADAPEYKLDLSQLSSQAANLVPKLKSEGITTIICGCDPIMPVFFSGEANRQGYYPEFINIGVALDDTDIVGQLWNPTFATHSFGISAVGDNADQPANSTIAYAAYKSVRPGDEPAFSVDLIYYQMYMLAIGIQGAGPNLNATTFQQGMFDYPAKFGPVGLWHFAPGDYTPQDDVREIYWDPTATSRYNGQKGRWTDPAPGARFPDGKFPQGPPVAPPALAAN
jgi:substrate-binding family protein